MNGLNRSKLAEYNNFERNERRFGGVRFKIAEMMNVALKEKNKENEVLRQLTLWSVSVVRVSPCSNRYRRVPANLGLPPRRRVFNPRPVGPAGRTPVRRKRNCFYSKTFRPPHTANITVRNPPSRVFPAESPARAVVRRRRRQCNHRVCCRNYIMYYYDIRADGRPSGGGRPTFCIIDKCPPVGGGGTFTATLT